MVKTVSVETREKIRQFKLGKLGEDASGWKGGKYTDSSNGYVYIYCPSHPHAKNGRYVAEHRLVLEKHLGRYLKNGETSHHINGIKDDNRIENLELVNKSQHINLHTPTGYFRKKTGRYDNCPTCGKSHYRFLYDIKKGNRRLFCSGKCWGEYKRKTNRVSLRTPVETQSI